jgi:hypothetical protein
MFPVQATPGLTHTPLLTWLDRTGMPSWSLGIACFIVLTLLAFVMLIVMRVPDPDIYRNSVAFVAIVSFLLTFYFRMGRGWHTDLLRFLEFDGTLGSSLDLLEPGRKTVVAELLLAGISTSINMMLNIGAGFSSPVFQGTVFAFLFLQYAIAIFCVDIVCRQLAALVQIVKTIRIDLLETEFYSSLANAMLRFVSLYIFGLCIITMSFLVFTEGEDDAPRMLLIMMPWYLPGMVLMSLYLVPYNIFRKRISKVKSLELNRVAEALKGNRDLLKDSLISDDTDRLTTIDLLYYRDLIRGVREWPFTNRIRSLVLFGILPPLTWVFAALVEILIEGVL